MAANGHYEDGFWRLYVHTNKINGKKYVGITSRKVEYRWNNGRGYEHNKHFSAAINKYGWENFEHEVLYDHLTKEEAQAKEIELIALWHTNDREFGYNSSSGGEPGNGVKPTREAIQKRIEARRGFRFSEETKEKMRQHTACTRPDVRQKALEAQQRTVNAYTMDGEYVGTWEQILKAAQALGLTDSQRCHVTDCCRGKRQSTGGYKWEYA